MTVLVVTNDFPPRQGGIETFVRSLCDELPDLVVLTSRNAGDTQYDSTLPFPVVRDRTSMLLPTPRVTRSAVRMMREYGADRVVFGAAAPLGLMGPALRKAGARRIVALTHGHETWWAGTPGTRQALRRIGDAADTLTTVSQWCEEQIAPALSASAAARMRRLTPGVDTTRFYPDCGGEQVRKGLGLEGVTGGCLCLAADRSQGTGHLDPGLAAGARGSAGRGTPDRRRRTGPGSAGGSRPADRCLPAVRFTGAVPWAEIPPYVDAADVFAMPCRTRRFGLEPEALGIVTLEASATGKPVVIGDSGGAGDTVRHGETGYLVDPYNPIATAVRLIELLTDPARARAMGEAGRAWVRDEWTWAQSGELLRELLDLR